jgi:hypothetical protein
VWLNCIAAATLDPEPTQHVWTDFRKESRNQPHYYFRGYTETDRTGKLSPDCLARYQLQFAYDSRVVAMEKTYLIELVF